MWDFKKLKFKKKKIFILKLKLCLTCWCIVYGEKYNIELSQIWHEIVCNPKCHNHDIENYDFPKWQHGDRDGSFSDITKPPPSNFQHSFLTISLDQHLTLSRSVSSLFFFFCLLANASFLVKLFPSLSFLPFPCVLYNQVVIFFLCTCFHQKSACQQ